MQYLTNLFVCAHFSLLVGPMQEGFLSCNHCPSILNQKLFFITLEKLDEANIEYVVFFQFPGMVVVNRPNCPHQGIILNLILMYNKYLFF
jgi:hypothetical protein